MIKAIIFDVDGVLIDSFESNLKFFCDLMDRAGYSKPTRQEYAGMFHMHMKDVICSLTKSQSKAEIDRIWLIGKNELHADPELVKTPKGLEEVIARLAKDFKLGIVTSRVGDRFFRFGNLAELKQYFDVIVSYEDTEKHKPDPEPLLLAADQLGVEPNECVYVGDTATDLLAARAAGMKILIYSEEKIDGADFCTNEFKDIPKLINNLKKSKK